METVQVSRHGLNKSADLGLHLLCTNSAMSQNINIFVLACKLITVSCILLQAEVLV